MSDETTYVMVKPDAVQRNQAFSILKRWEKRGYTLVGLKMQVPSKEQAENHYAEHSARPFFPSLIQFLTSGPVVAAAFKGPNVIAASRQMLGKTNPLNAELGSIRGDFAVSGSMNCCHASDSKEAADRELGIWFKQDEIINWKPDIQKWVWD